MGDTRCAGRTPAPRPQLNGLSEPAQQIGANPPGRQRLLTQAQLGILRPEILGLSSSRIEVLTFQASRVAIDARLSDIPCLGRSNCPEELRRSAACVCGAAASGVDYVSRGAHFEGVGGRVEAGLEDVDEGEPK